MPRREDETQPTITSYPMLKFAEDLGHIKRGVHNLEDGQREVDEKVSGLYKTVANLVTKDDCKLHRDTTTEIVIPESTFPPPSSPLQLPLLERMGKTAKALTAIIALVGLIGAILLAASRFIASVETALEKDRQAQQVQQKALIQEFQKAREPVIVHKPVYVYPDAGTRRRRRRRRPARTAN